MTSRKILLLDRAAALLLALILIAAGAGAIWWWSGTSPAPDTLSARAIKDLMAQSWWPWASGAAGLLLILLALRWIAAHVRTRGVANLNLKGSDSSGRLDVAGSKVAGAAAEALTDTLGVRSAKGRVIRDRGQIVARLDAAIEPGTDLHLVAVQADLVSAQLAHVLDRDDVRCSVQLRVVTRGRSLPRAN